MPILPSIYCLCPTLSRFFLENVVKFAVAGTWKVFSGVLDPTVHKLSQNLLDLMEMLEALGYTVIPMILSPLNFGVPNRRPRFWLAAMSAWWSPAACCVHVRRWEQQRERRSHPHLKGHQDYRLSGSVRFTCSAPSGITPPDRDTLHAEKLFASLAGQIDTIVGTHRCVLRIGVHCALTCLY